LVLCLLHDNADRAQVCRHLSPDRRTFQAPGRETWMAGSARLPGGRWPTCRWSAGPSENGAPISHVVLGLSGPDAVVNREPLLPAFDAWRAWCSLHPCA